MLDVLESRINAHRKNMAEHERVKKTCVSQIVMSYDASKQQNEDIGPTIAILKEHTDAAEQCLAEINEIKEFITMGRRIGVW